MINDKDLLSIEVARMYYEFDKTQQEISETFSISRPTVSKLLKYAKEKKYIQIKIENPTGAIDSLEQSLKEKFNLKDVRVAYSNHLLNSDIDVRSLLGKEAAAYLDEVVVDKQQIGISWGKTLHNVSMELQPKLVQNVEIIQLKGGMNLVQADTHDQEIMTQFVKKYNAKGQYIPLPVIFETEKSKDSMMREKQIQTIMEKIRNVDIALYTIGDVSKESLLYRMQYITEDEFSYLKENAVCDICSRFIDANGNICLKDLDRRTFGINLEDLSKVKYSILIAGGDLKIKGIYIALKNQIPNVLITDSVTAMKLLEY